MLISSSRIIGVPVLSLHVGAPIARTVQPIISPHHLRIVAFIVDGPLVGRDDVGDILDVRSIREFSSLGMIINSTDELVSREDAIRLKEILALNFQLEGKKVITKKGTKLGKVIDYTLNPETMQISQLIVKRPTLKAIIDPELIIPFSKIIKITDSEIVIKDEEEKIRKDAVKKDFTPNFVNPFREPHYAPAQTKTPDEPDTE